MPKITRVAPEVRERAVRLLWDPCALLGYWMLGPQ